MKMIYRALNWSETDHCISIDRILITINKIIFRVFVRRRERWQSRRVVNLRVKMSWEKRQSRKESSVFVCFSIVQVNFDKWGEKCLKEVKTKFGRCRLKWKSCLMETMNLLLVKEKFSFDGREVKEFDVFIWPSAELIFTWQKRLI